MSETLNSRTPGDRQAKPAPDSAKPAIWQSLSEFEGELSKSEGVSEEVASFVGREFPTDDFDQMEGVDRRRFMQILGASAALAGASSCRWEKENIYPYTNRPEDTVPGRPKYFASVLDLAGAARPVMVTAYDFRPVKVEPNTLVGSGTDVYSQGEILGFYDPDRSRRVAKKGAAEGATSKWDDALADLMAKKAEGGLAILASTTSSPTLGKLAGELAGQNIPVTWWSPVGQDNAIAGSRMAFGSPMRAVYSLEEADVVVTLDCDFQRNHPDAVRMAGEFAKRRMPEEGNMSRLYSVESRFTSTGVTSDHRLPVRSADVGAVLELLKTAMGQGSPLSPRATELGANPKVKAFVDAATADIQGAGGKAVILPGDSQPPEVHAHVHAIHQAIGAIGKTVKMLEEPLAAATNASLKGLVDGMNAGQVKTLLILGGNPVYDAPADLEFGEAMAKVTSMHLSLYKDETSEVADWHLPAAHWLESWGDARSWSGAMHIAQPIIKPLHGGKSAIEVCSLLLGRLGNARAEVQMTFDRDAQLAPGSAEGNARFRHAIHDGVADGVKLAEVAAKVNVAGLPAIPTAAAGTEVTFFPCPKIFDGRFANNGWLQELPDFTTKMTWDNAALIGVTTAKALGVTTGDMVSVAHGGRTIEAAAYVAPGQAEGSVAISLGYGRQHAGVIAGFAPTDVAAAGFNAYPLRSTGAMGFGVGATLAKASGSYKFATTQEHHLIDEIGMQGRRERLHKLVMEGTEEQWKEDPAFPENVYHVPKLESLFEQKEYEGTHQWGMTIDLSTCNGCNACVIACQSENNIPIVGKEQVSRGREMHWMRVDLYYQGDADDASTVDAVNQPINCLQCENAPCEQVCPVAATVHSEEGTNDMVYNRCIGTRYCGNNCPVKVRRFNYFHYTKYMDKPETKLLQLGQNPNVTVRSRGVMEKCTYCAQRISEARITARNEGRKIRDGEVITACQSSCPTQAIHFGDLTDPESKVSKKQALGRDYSMLAELNLKPRTQYLARISNPNPALSESMPQGVKARADYDPHIYEPHGGHGGDHGAHEEGAHPEGGHAAEGDHSEGDDH